MGRFEKGLIALPVVFFLMYLFAGGLPVLDERLHDEDPGFGWISGLGTEGPPTTPLPTFTPRPVTPTATPEPTWTPYPASPPQPTLTPVPNCDPGQGWNTHRNGCENLTVMTAAENAQLLDSTGGFLATVLFVAFVVGGLWLSRKKKE